MHGTNSIYKLTALWAFAECSLGGLMHLFKVPFTGFFIGGFAIIIIGLISFLSNQSFKIIIQSTLLVILVKAAVSPQSPPAAYFAVFFQGLFGAIVFKSFGFNKISAIVFGSIAMIESSIQMIISKTIFYGMSFWNAIDVFFINVIKEFGLKSGVSFSFWLIVFYLLLYAIWGVVLGYWLSNLPSLLAEKWSEIKYKVISVNLFELPKNKHKYKKIKWLGFGFTLSFIIIVMLLNGEHKWDALFVILRTVSVIALLYFIVMPFIQFVIKKYSVKKQEQINEIVNELPKIRQTAELAYALASENKNGISKYKEFVWILITLTLYDEA
jgi:hypothetical protein